MDIQDLRYFVAVAQTLNITKAAEELFITRQALSKAIHDLEKECGSELFLRGNGKLQLTPFGRNLLEKSIPVMDSFSVVEKAVSSGSSRKKSKLRIAMGLGTINALSPQVFASFRRDYPTIELTVKEVCDDEVRRDLAAMEADLGILNSTPVKLVDFDFRLIRNGRVWFQVSTLDPLSRKDLLSPGDLHRQPLVTLGERFDVHCVLMEKCREIGLFPDIVLETLDSNVANDMVYNNVAVSFFIPTRNAVIHPATRIIPMDLGDTPWGTYVISRKGFEHTPATNLLIDYLDNFPH